MAATQIPIEVLAVLWQEIVWEDANVPPPNVLFAHFYGDFDNMVFLILRLAEAIKIGNPPDMVTELNDWCLFILNELVEFGQDFDISNIKSIIQNQDRWDIADAAELAINADPQVVTGLWQEWFDLRHIVNQLLSPIIAP